MVSRAHHNKMSIILGPFDSDGEETPKKAKDEELLVFGYACKLYRDEAKSIMENSGQFLIPWMGNSLLMVDRYDVRNKLDDQSQFGLKPNIPRPMTTKELDFEEELDRERYFALECDEIRVEEEEEMEKRRLENAFNAIGFTYNTAQTSSHKPKDKNWDHVRFDADAFHFNLRRLEHPSTATVDYGSEMDRFVPCAGLVFPSGMHLPLTNKLHSIIEKTASFISKQGTQMEIIIKTRQKFNPFFSFLNHHDVLYPYFKYMKEVISTGRYVPLEKEPEKREGDGVNERREPMTNHKETKEQVTEMDAETLNSEAPVTKVEQAKINTEPPGSKSDSEAESDSDDEGYLHPLLLSSSISGKTKATPTPTPTPTSSSSLPSSTSSKLTSSNKETPGTDARGNERKLTLDEILNLHSTTASFVARSRAINSAPSTEGEATQVYETASDVDPEVVAAYEFYRQQYFASLNNNTAPEVVTGHEGAYSHAPPSDISTLPFSGDGYEQQQQQYPPSNGHYPPPPYDHYPSAHVPSSASYDQYPPAYYYHQPEGIPPPDIRPIVDKTAEYVAKNCETFERTVLDRHLSDPRFSFLNPWDPCHAYYEAMKKYNRDMLEPEVGGMTKETEEVLQRPNLQKLSSNGTVSFKLQPAKTASSTTIQAPLSGFEEEMYSEEEVNSEHVDYVIDERVIDERVIDERVIDERVIDERGEGAISECGFDDQEHPPAKKQRLDDDDEIGNTVQAFLSTVKSLFT